MELIIEETDGVKISRVRSSGIVLHELDDALDLLGNSDYQGASCIILQKEQIIEEFFDLKTGLAGEILQKFSNYRKRLAIVGDFSAIKSKSMNDFIRESNRTGQINFVATIHEARQLLSKASS